MNRGSALKWIELLRADNVVLNDGWGLKLICNNIITYSPCGVLEEFIQQGMNKLSWHECGYETKEQSELLVSGDTLKKVKAKTNLEIVDNYICQNSPSKDRLIEWMLENYESF